MIKERLEKLRNLLAKQNYAGYIISTKDEYLCEYAPDCAKRLEYITGFDGSNGIALILQDIVLFFTDGRYLQQCKEQLCSDSFKIFDIANIKNFAWNNYIGAHDIITYDPKIFTKNIIHAFKGLPLQPCALNLIDQIWDNRPSKPASVIYDYAEKYAGESCADKLQKLRGVMYKNNASAIFIADPESVCWLLNIRAHDLEFTPIALCYCLVTIDEVYLFTEKDRCKFDYKSRGVIIEPEKNVQNILAGIDGCVMFDASACSEYLQNIIESGQYKNIKNPVSILKAIKNDVEIERAEKCHITDAVALCEMFAYINSADPSNLNELSEYDIGVKLTEYRSHGKDYQFDSFPAICGFGSNGAVIHYRAGADSAKKIEGDGLLLIDSGGQYLGSTTDVTRVLPIGAAQNISTEHKLRYTQVLKGHIALADAKFPSDKVSGANLDVLARQYLWQDGTDYAHGTGHGVGGFLSVHEGPQNISLNSHNVPLQAGMILSNEPGFYKAGEYGIRIENLMYVKNSSNNGYLEFENLTMVPYCRNLIDFSMLSDEEKQYLQKYYSKIRQVLNGKLSNAANAWLEYHINI